MTNTPKEIWEMSKSIDGNLELRLGPYTSRHLLNDPKHFGFFLSRYKFAGKMLGETKDKKVLEVGCGEGIGTLILSQFAKTVTGIDFDESAIKWASENIQKQNLSFFSKNIFNDTDDNEQFDAIISLDVIEHIEQSTEDEFIKSFARKLNDNGFCIIGTPNITSSEYASPASKAAHINMYSFSRLNNLMLKYFKNTFCFGMNDEVLQTGFHPMCHYIIIIGCTQKV